MKFKVIVSDPPWSADDPLAMNDVKRGAAANYATLSIDDLKKLPVQDVADPDGCVLCIWVLGSMLQEGMDLMKAWGFEQKQVYVWVKTKKEPFGSIIKSIYKNTLASCKSLVIPKNLKDTKENFKKFSAGLASKVKVFTLNDILAFGMGRLFRQTHEICIIGTRGKKVYKSLKNKSQRSVSFSANDGHSIKPTHLQDSLDLMFPNSNKLEMFARRDRANWVCVGLECPSSKGEDIKDSLKRVAGM